MHVGLFGFALDRSAILLGMDGLGHAAHRSEARGFRCTERQASDRTRRIGGLARGSAAARPAGTAREAEGRLRVSGL